ncbi:hypothetical protein B0I35DRAFT_425806 [Stachybotrys elegans]|uniref:Zn(2)-C6 fungal-type domain-containing protein n=1 Tax=Stachybotrys elegans TaxID=80388 RepID=A0A8K0T0D6_9HYPO|nr:hypothetical protein B0I35DRAFT_425806 [Stachybotrys elegans]
MLKRSHRKTKKGSKCAECRQRHIRCDLQRPACINCLRAERVCSFTSDSGPETANAAIGKDASLSSQSGLIRYPHGRAGSDCTLAKPLDGYGLGEDASLVNMCHLELFHYYISMPSPYIGGGDDVSETQRRLVVHTSLSTPYLMHETLAFAAKHRSITHRTDRSQFYSEQAKVLQTRALSLFNKSRLQPGQENCTAIFLFSGMLGVHILAETFTDSTPDSDFVASFVSYLKIHRSLRSLATGLWPMLMKTELAPVLLWASKSTAAHTHDINEHRLLAMLSEATDLSSDSVDACIEALKLLHWALQDDPEPRLKHGRCVQMAFVWPLSISPHFIDLLAARRPEALVIFAYYGQVLRMCQNIWAIGESGNTVINTIVQSLDEKWIGWLS